jgi:hypothetical protein
MTYARLKSDETHTEDCRRRVLIQAHVKQIPGDPNGRPWTLWKLFCNSHLHRDTKLEFDGVSHLDGFDVVHVLPRNNSPEDIKAWFLIDVGFEAQTDIVEVNSLPHEVFLACFEPENRKWYEYYNTYTLMLLTGQKDFCEASDTRWVSKLLPALVMGRASHIHRSGKR